MPIAPPRAQLASGNPDARRLQAFPPRAKRAGEWWRRRESNPQEARAVAGFQGGGTKGDTKNGGDPPGVEQLRAENAELRRRLALATQARVNIAATVEDADLRRALRELLATASPELPDALRAGLARLIDATNDTTRTLHAGKQESERVEWRTASEGGRHGAS